jgi:hypothetical protein
MWGRGPALCKTKLLYIAVNACLGWLNNISGTVKEQNIIYMEI